MKHEESKRVMLLVHELYSLSRVVNDLASFRENDYITTEQGHLFKDRLVQILGELKPHAIKLTDAFGTTDKILQSSIAKNDG